MPPLWQTKKNFIILTGLVVFHLVLISVQVPMGGEKTVFERAVFVVFSPIQHVVVSGFHGLNSVWTNYFDLRGVRSENQRLRKELFFLAQENRFLEDRLQFFKAESLVRENLSDFRKSLISARVIGADAGNYYKSLVLDKGFRDGVRKDMAVCDKFGNLMGRVIEPVSPGECMVQLITDEESSVSVISDADRIVGILWGTSGIICDLKYVLASTQGGKIDEELKTTGLDKIYPAGIRVGRICVIEPGTTIFKSIKVQPYFNFNAIEAVAILPRVTGGGQ